MAAVRSTTAESPRARASAARYRSRWLLLLILALPAGGGAAALEPATGAAGADPAPPPAATAGAPLSAEHRRWLAEVEPMITEAERQAFLAISREYQRSAFIDGFWQVRDPFPETARNELRERWEARLAEARQRFDDPALDDRPRMFAVFGEPAAVFPGRCGGLLEPLEIWRYEGSERVRGTFHLVFVRGRGADSPSHRLWSPGDGLMGLVVGASVDPLGDQLLRRVAEECFRGDDVAAALVSAADWERLRETLFPDPGSEWVRTFTARSTDVPAEAEAFDARLELSYPGRHQSRTVLQALLAVPRTEAVAGTTGPVTSYDFLVDGEVLRKDELFESFRYRFHLPQGDVGGDTIPLLFQRYLRPGIYRLVLRAEDLASGRFHRREIDLEVPLVRPGQPAAPATAATLAAAPEDPAAEANASLVAGDQTLRLIPPPPGLQVGNTRFEAVVGGEGIARVRFSLDGRPVMSKTRSPYSVELDLGDAPRTHHVVAAALGDDGGVLARDEVLVNAGPHRFAVRLVEPQRGRTYSTSLRAQVEVEVPETDRLDRVELYLNDTRVATLYQPPFAHPMLLPPATEVAYVRAVAYLGDGNSAEDLVFVNAPEYLEEIDVNYIELYTTVLDRRGRPVEGLTEADFRVLEEGVEQRLHRFELVRDLPIYAGILLDNSSSMAEEIGEAVAAALRFFDTVLTPKDRATVLTFNHAPELVVRFTNDPEVLAGGVAGITAEGGTALYDSLIYALYYFSGINGKRAIVLLSDGDDQGSDWSFDEALEYARRTGVSIYAIGLGLPAGNAMVRMQLQRLADETGGRTFFVDRARDLGRVYEAIEEELRTQYLLAYQSSYDGDDKGFRRVEVEVARPGAEAKTVSGYFP